MSGRAWETVKSCHLLEFNISLVPLSYSENILYGPPMICLAETLIEFLIAQLLYYHIYVCMSVCLDLTQNSLQLVAVSYV